MDKPGSNGNTYWLPTYELVATVGQEGGPSWDDFDRCRRLYQRLTERIALEKSRIDAKSDNNAPQAWANPPKSDAPPPTGEDTPRSFDDLDDDIPF